MLGVSVRVPKWECELWDYISSGDGKCCPRYKQCKHRQGGGWCPSDHLGLISQVLDDKKFSSAKYDCIVSRWGRLSQLVEMLAIGLVGKGRISCPPVPEKVAFLADEHSPIEIRVVPLKTYHGAIWHIDGSWIIHLNGNDTPARRRFTLFHEVFHILAHRRCTPVFRRRDCEAGSFNEMLADYFAICAMMPRKWVEEKWAEAKNLHRMAETFEVERPVTWIRLREMGLI